MFSVLALAGVAAVAAARPNTYYTVSRRRAGAAGV
jgi:hypothetical protein